MNIIRKNGRNVFPVGRLGGISSAILNDEAVNKEQLDKKESDFLAADNTFSGNNTFSGTVTVSNGVTAGTMLAGFFPVAAQQALTDTGAVNVTSYHTAWTTTGAATGTLADGTQKGQIKKITMVADLGDAVLTPATLSGGTTITFNDAGDFVVLIWDSAWKVIENSGCTIA